VKKEGFTMEKMILTSNNIPVFTTKSVAGKTIRYLADREMGGLQNFALGISSLAPGVRGTKSGHECEEVFYFLTGKATIVIDGESVVVNPGTVVFVPPNILHSIENNSENECEYLWVASPQPDRISDLQAKDDLINK
jgi:mannose-6-phosphate isomerase-like protein (cupin superfamily)